ncbi:CU044_5270 family protein [Streptomyces sp. NPDC002851]
MNEADETFRSLDPARGTTTPPDDAALERILATPRQHDALPPRRAAARRSRRWVWASAAAVTTAAAGLVLTNMLGTAPQPALAVTPQPLKYQESDRSAAAVLENIARHVEHLPKEAPRGGTQRFVQDSWSLSTRIDGIQVTSAVIPERRITWKKPDGSEKWTVRSGTPEFQSDAQREQWEEAGSVGDEPEESHGSSGPADMSDRRNHHAPTTPHGMKKWLALGYSSNGPGETFDSVAERLLDRNFSTAQRAALLRALKDSSGIDYRGRVKDRAGRVGDAFTVQSKYGGLPKMQTLVFSSSSGKLLAYEEELTSDAGSLNVKPPAVVLYITYL